MDTAIRKELVLYAFAAMATIYKMDGSRRYLAFLVLFPCVSAFISPHEDILPNEYIVQFSPSLAVHDLQEAIPRSEFIREYNIGSLRFGLIKTEHEFNASEIRRNFKLIPNRIFHGYSHGSKGTTYSHSQGSKGTVHEYRKGSKDTARGHSQGSKGTSHGHSKDSKGTIHGHGKGSKGTSHGHSQDPKGTIHDHSQGSKGIIQNHSQDHNDKDVCYAQETGSIYWGLTRISHINRPAYNPHDSYLASETGQCVNIYVVDTGINIIHDTFRRRGLSGYTVDDLKDSEGEDDEAGHGTHVAGLAAGRPLSCANKTPLI